MYGAPKTTTWNEEMLQQALRNGPAWDNEGTLPPWEYYPQGEKYKPPLPPHRHPVDLDPELIQRMRDAFKEINEQRAREQREKASHDLVPAYLETVAAKRIAGAIADYYAAMQVVRWHERVPRPRLNLKTPYLLPSLETQSSSPYEWSTTPIPAMVQDVYMVQDLYPSSPFTPAHHFLGLPEPEPLEIPLG